MDNLSRIVARKRLENERRRSRLGAFPAIGRSARSPRPSAAAAVSALRRVPGAPVGVIAEIKFRSPSVGRIRARTPGVIQTIARAYETAGASAISVLCDGPGFGGSPLDIRRAAAAVRTPLLFKEFVLEPMQLELARRVGASMVLLLVRILSQVELDRLVAASRAIGLAPVVEAADEHELERALTTSADIVGVNARDLRTFRVDTARAEQLVAHIPEGRVAIHMSGVATEADIARVAAGRADAVLIGEALMRAEDPGARLGQLLAAAG